MGLLDWAKQMNLTLVNKHEEEGEFFVDYEFEFEECNFSITHDTDTNTYTLFTQDFFEMSKNYLYFEKNLILMKYGFVQTCGD